MVDRFTDLLPGGKQQLLGLGIGQLPIDLLQGSRREQHGAGALRCVGAVHKGDKVVSQRLRETWPLCAQSLHRADLAYPSMLPGCLLARRAALRSVRAERSTKQLLSINPVHISPVAHPGQEIIC